MVVQSLYILNKAGSLMYHKDFDGRPRLDENDYLRLGSAFHAFDVIATEMNPLNQKERVGEHRGIKVIETTLFRLHCFEAHTGTKFFVSADPSDTAILEDLLDKIYKAYCDFVLKNPFYEVDQVIKQNAKFDAALISIVNAANSSRK